ncbi:MAG: class I SAM-dependent methyltransferase [Verrucomicrobia bacterium]|nr:class I SAM-dependent methyltransferase [Verrucomicrobiota bacterium]
MNTSSTPTQSSYDKVLYPSYTRIQTHPDRLATIATLFGMAPASVERCRMLELGCGNGSNLGPMAFTLPGSQFVGIDAAGIPIARAKEMAKELGMVNVAFHQGDILEVSADLGQFDYIVAHGVYSWVPPAVRDKLMEICRVNLAPQGVAFISYNAYPGNYLSRMVREMMLYRVRGLEKPEEAVEQALALAKFVTESRDQSDAFRELLREELERFVNTSPNYIFHDALAEINEPSYFHEFMAHAARHQLQYLGEADFHEMLDRVFKPEVGKTLGLLAGTRIEREQFLDFVKCRRFRQTLLCHEGVPLDLALKPELVTRFCVASTARPASPQPDFFGPTVETFEGRKGSNIKTSCALSKTAFGVLGEIWPQPLPFSELLARVQEKIKLHTGRPSGPPEQDAVELGKTILQSYAAGLVELHTFLPQYARQVSERPVASPLARWQARQGNFVTSLYHYSMAVDDALGREMLLRLDGHRTRAALLEELLAFAQARQAIRTPDGQPVTDLEQVRALLGVELEKNLGKLARMGLLVA